MAQNQDLILKLIEKLELLYKKQADFNSEIDNLKEELYRLKSTSQTETSKAGSAKEIQKAPLTEEEPKIQKEVKESTKEASQSKEGAVVPNEAIKAKEESSLKSRQDIEKPNVSKPFKQASPPKPKSNLEKFVGENLLNKIGIIITIVGVAIGAKYSIENDLISPLTRIILGYITAIALLGFGIKLKKNYEAYSAVLVSGSIVILYFITFFAYSFYDLFAQLIAFALMVVFTAFTVVAAISYNRQIIAHLGLVGAYAIPFLLSDDSGRVEVLFGYIAIINIGILIIAFKKYWKPLYYSAFTITWLIYATWFIFDFKVEDHFTLAFGFLLVFFLIFYLTFLAYKLLKKELFSASDIIMLMINSFVFYGFGYAILSSYVKGEALLGAFTLGNAVIHFIVTVIIYKQKLADRNLFYLASGLVLIFITITIPVQLDGNWVTLLWVGEAALLFWIGRTKQVPVYEKLSYPLMILAFLSIVQDWGNQYNFYYSAPEHALIPIFNINFLSSALFIAAFICIIYVFRKKVYKPDFKIESAWYTIMSYVIPIILIFVLYFAFRLEIAAYWDQLFHDSALKVNTTNSYSSSIKNYDLRDFRRIWILNYSLFFIAAMALFNFKFIKSKVFQHITAGLAVATIFIFLVQGLYLLSELRESYLYPSEYYKSGIFYLIFRYISFVFLAFALFACYKYIKQEGTKRTLRILYDLLLHISIVWVLSSELIHWMDLSESEQSYKLGLSILWGVYSFLLIAFGIWKNKKYLRIGGIGLFGITLMKLFFYDIAHLNTISKTIVFVALGILLLIISFLYNKYKNLITDDIEH